MALHLNLYHEIHKQKELQRRDPLKFAIAGLIAVGVGLAGFYGVQLTSKAGMSKELSKLKQQYATLTPKAEAAKKRSEEIDLTMKQGESLVKRMEQRFYWAPVLDSLVALVPPDVQVTKFGGEVIADGAKRCSLSLEGRAAGDDPRRVAEDLRRTISEEFATKYQQVTATFRSLDDSPETATLQGRKLPTVIFNINVVMQIADEQPATTADAARRTAQK
jgi:Tfp pilus assembly protein PilN